MATLSGKVALVTGAARRGGLGRAIAERLAAEGAAVMLTDIGAAVSAQFGAAHVGLATELDASVEQLAQQGHRVAGTTLDVRDEMAWQQAIAATVERFGRLDILVNNAGIGYLMQLVTELSWTDWDAVLAVNLGGPFLGTKHAAQQMIAQGGGGRIINIASQAAKSGFPYAAAYTSSKHGLLGLTRATAVELGGHGITVNAVCPNHVTTGLGAWQNEFFAEKLGLTLEQYLTAMKNRIPLGRPGLPQDTAAACAWLASDSAGYITGEALNVSGGEEMH
jgi:NAD(P)-dependent dehydrogenase (short-subunit alcohol dehydrogenase family)